MALKSASTIASRTGLYLLRGHHHIRTASAIRPFSDQKSGKRTSWEGQHITARIRKGFGPAKEPDFYTRYLSKRIRSFEPHEITGTWLQALVPGRPGVTAASRSDGNGLDVFSDMDASIETTITSLEAFVGSVHSVEREKDAARKHYIAQQPGRKALLWLLESQAYVRFDLLLHPRFAKLVAHCLTAERADDHLWASMLTKEMPAESTPNAIHATRWKSRVFRATVEACAFWTADQECINKTHACFQRAFVDSSDLRPGFYVPKSSAGEYLMSLIRKTNPSHVDVEVFQRFVTSIAAWIKDPFDLSFTRSSMYLRHPVQPNADYALDVFREVSNARNRTPSMDRIFGNRGEKGSSALFLHFIRTAQVLEHQSRHQEARWVLDFGRAEMPAYFDGERGRQKNPFEGVDEAIYKRLPSADEKHRGIPVDSDGHVIFVGKADAYRNAARKADR